MFEQAARLKIRFQFKGLLSVEDLWDLSVQDLDAIFKRLNAEAKISQEASLLEQRTADDEILDLTISIVKHIVATKLTEQESREQAVAQIARKQKLLAILEQKQDEELYGMSQDEIQNLINEMALRP